MMHPIDLYQQIIDKYGEDNVMNVATEEMAELTKELTKRMRKDTNVANDKEIAEEIADVRIAMDELMYMFDNESLVDEIMEYKYCRTHERMKR